MHNFFHHSVERQITEPPVPRFQGGKIAIKKLDTMFH